MALLEEHGINPTWILTLHCSGDWGTLDKEDQQANEEALHHGGRLLSCYYLCEGDRDSRCWVITDAAFGEDPLVRPSTTLLRPDEY